jgi:hypothetical protein
MAGEWSESRILPTSYTPQPGCLQVSSVMLRSSSLTLKALWIYPEQTSTGLASGFGCLRGALAVGCLLGRCVEGFIRSCLLLALLINVIVCSSSMTLMELCNQKKKQVRPKKDFPHVTLSTVLAAASSPSVAYL